MNDMKKYIMTLLLIVFFTASCKKMEFSGAPEYKRIDVSVTQLDSSTATISIIAQGFFPIASSLIIINTDNGNQMSFTTSYNDLSSVKLQGLQSNKKYTIYVLLQEDGGHYYRSPDVEFTTK